MMKTKHVSQVKSNRGRPDPYADEQTDSCPVAQLTWVPAPDAAPRPVTLTDAP
jgi:hypothetical protein